MKLTRLLCIWAMLCVPAIKAADVDVRDAFNAFRNMRIQKGAQFTVHGQTYQVTEMMYITYGYGDGLESFVQRTDLKIFDVTWNRLALLVSEANGFRGLWEFDNSASLGILVRSQELPSGAALCLSAQKIDR